MRTCVAAASLLAALFVTAFLSSLGNAATPDLSSPDAALPSAGPALNAAMASPEDGLWMFVNPAPRRLSHSVIYDPVRKRMLMFGGSDGADRNDAWELDLEPEATWTPLTPAGMPPAVRRLHTAVYDPVRDRMLVFGGYNGSYLNDLWELTLAGVPTWHLLSPAGGMPAARAGHVAVYDPDGDRMIVFGGHDGVSLPSLRRNDVWALSLAGPLVWTELTPAGALPAPRSSHSAIYDPGHRQMVVFGGTASFTTYLNDTWTLALTGTPVWTLLGPAGPPPPARESHSAVYDAHRDRMVIFGGDPGGGFYHDDTWSLALGGATAWSQLAPAGVTPDPRWGHAAICDPLGDRMAMFGGWSSGYADEMWLLEWGGPVPVDLAEFTVTSAADQVLVRWRTALETDHLGFYVQRDRDARGDFVRLSGLVESTGAWGSTYEYIDRDVTPGQIISYRLESVSRGGDSRIYSAVRVQVAAATDRFMLYPIRPNPFNPAATISFELPARGETTLAIYDSRGQLVRTLLDAPLGSGVHQVAWDGRDNAGRAASSGVYFCRLLAAGRKSTQKMVLAQ